MSRSTRSWLPRPFRWPRNQRPIPLAPQHRRLWRGARPSCSCGLPWRTCPDRHTTVPTEPATAPTPPNRPTWNAPTVANPKVGRAGWLTLAQTWRANGGKW